jgi:hypothetical protein
MTPDTILDLAEHCLVAYDDAPQGSFALEDGQSKPRGFAYRFEDSGLIAFAGSESILDWLTDFMCIQKRYEKGAVHRGFLDEFEKVWPQISKIFRGIPSGFKIQITGHSLGGALSMLAAREFGKMFGCDVTHVSFGCPRVFDRILANEFNKIVPNSIRIQHHNDLVPRVPKILYRHSGKLIRIDDDGKEIKFAGILGTIERWFEVARADLTLSAGEDHPIRNYIPAIRKWYERMIAKGKGDVR